MWAPAAAIAGDNDEPGDDADQKPDEQPSSRDPSGKPSDGDEESEEEGEAATVLPRDGGKGAVGVEEEKGGETGGEQDRGGSSSSREGPTTNGAVNTNEVAEEAGEKEQEKGNEREGFSFATELFFLTHRALQVIVSCLDRRRGEMLKVVSDNALAKTGRPLSNEEDDGEVAAGGGGGGMAGRLFSIYKEASTAVSLGWALEGFGSDAVTGHGCQLANFTACWLRLHIVGENGSGGDAPASAPSSSSLSVVTKQLSKITPILIETMCASWVRGALNGRDDQFLSRRAAEDAAIFCGQMMELVGQNCVSRASWIRFSSLCHLMNGCVIYDTHAERRRLYRTCLTLLYFFRTGKFALVERDFHSSSSSYAWCLHLLYLSLQAKTRPADKSLCRSACMKHINGFSASRLLSLCTLAELIIPYTRLVHVCQTTKTK